MRKTITALTLASVLTLGPAAVSYAQTDQVAAAQEADDDDDDSDKTGLWGLLGLLGLAGLAGLKRRNEVHTTTTTRPGTGSSSGTGNL